MNEIGKLIEETLNIDEIKSKCMIDYTESYNKRAQRTLCLAQIINYCILFRSNDGIVDYINTENKKDFLIKKIAFLLNIDNENIEAKFDEILKFTYFNFFVDGFIFHATNSLFGNQMITNGFSERNNDEEKSDIVHINQILQKSGKLTPFKFVFFDLSHDYTGLFCNSNPLLITDYCYGPEWFRLFCGEAPVYDQLVDYKKEKGFRNKNYDDALECVKKLIEYHNLPDNDAKEVLDFFNKYWNKFKDATPMVILIPTKMVFDNDTMLNAIKKNLDGCNIDHIFDIISSGKSLLYDNFCVKNSIDNTNLSYFSLEQIMLAEVNKFNFGRINKISLDDSFMESVVHRTKIGEQLNFGESEVEEVQNDTITFENENVDEQDIFVEQKNPFNANGPVYAFTNEALNQFMSNYDFSGKTVLSSLGSGDFALNAYLLGAKSVESFDINQYTYYFYQLKKALIMRYDYEEFCELVKNPTNIFKQFDDYKPLLDSESRLFFEKILKIYGDDIKGLLDKMYIDKVEEKNQWNESNTFDSTEELFLIAKYKNYYLHSSENYDSLRKRIASNPNEAFYFKDLYQFTPPKKYDIVYLSNIGDYCKSEEEFKMFVEDIKAKYLNENGIIIIVSITNHIYMNSEEAERTKMDWDDMEKFNAIHKGVAELPLSNLGIQNVYTTYPYQIKEQHYRR